MKRSESASNFGISLKSGVENDRYFENEISGTAIYMFTEIYDEGYKPNTSSDIWVFVATIYDVLQEMLHLEMMVVLLNCMK